jgi:DNA/RNA endonuclease G (NUC1)
MKKLQLLVLLVLTSVTLLGQTIRTVQTEIFTAVYSEVYQQPLEVTYIVKCPTGTADRAGMDFFKPQGLLTSDNADYANNVWDKGHMAPAAAFNCDLPTLKQTFSYANCVLQHEGLNRGPWKELERFERDLAKVYPLVKVTITCHFEDKPQNWLKTGALVPVGFTKTIVCGSTKFKFYFPNLDVAGQDWGFFQIK